VRFLFTLSRFGYYIKTLSDIGFLRIGLRVYSLFQNLLATHAPKRLLVFIYKLYLPIPAWKFSYPPILCSCNAPPLTPSSALSFDISFSFLSHSQSLSFPFAWNSNRWSRLWQFNLHYFDWARAWLDESLVSGSWPASAVHLEALIDGWIESNPIGTGDGWHSYTISLRSRNWIFLFRSHPSLVTPDRIRSLWHQLLWLQSHPENANGGNHWLENLIALCLGSLQFDSSAADNMHRRAMTLLEDELSNQILSDGGHEERSTSYHLLMLDRLIELGCFLSFASLQIPSWLIESISKMTNWVTDVRIGDSLIPRFNDSSPDAAPSISLILSFAKAFLHTGSSARSFDDLDPLRASLISHLPSSYSPVSLRPQQRPVCDLISTGWTFVRPDNEWSLIFKSGIPCPNHLPGHAHSDILSFDLAYKNKWVIAEAGTSIYGDCPLRHYERSGAAHNVLQLGIPHISGQVFWLEPVEVWGNFRAANKAQPLRREYIYNHNSSITLLGEHDGYKSYGISHTRSISIPLIQDIDFRLSVSDTVTTHQKLLFRQWFHLAPGVTPDLANKLSVSTSTPASVSVLTQSTNFSLSFGNRIPRHSILIRGVIPPSRFSITTTIPFDSKIFDL